MTMTDLDLETWILDAGNIVLAKKQEGGADSLAPLDELVLCLWAADYGMRNAGDLETANDLNEGFQLKAQKHATSLGLPVTLAALSLPTSELEQRYFDLLEGVVQELKAAGAPTP